MRDSSDSRHSNSKYQNILGERFIERIRNELSVMRHKWEAARKGDASSLEQLLHFAHRIGGAGGMLGFEQISIPMRNIERILRAGVLSAGDWQEIESHLQQLHIAMNDAEEALTI
jgi:HPt (histidine-containing phosphotransfer) domain-containing protein